MEQYLGGTALGKYYITGDMHGNFLRLVYFTDEFQTTIADTIIILGDAGINFSGDAYDRKKKEFIAKLPITLFCIHGNHDKRPETIPSYTTKKWHGGEVYFEQEYPNMLFAKDGEVYDIDGKKTIVIGGAYSVDKWYRLNNGYPWFADEQPSERIKAYVEKQLEKSNWTVDVVLSHTTPYQYMPTDMFLKGINQSQVDNSTEEWLQVIENKLNYSKWYCGHYHIDRVIAKLEIMYGKVGTFCSDEDLHFNIV